MIGFLTRPQKSDRAETVILHHDLIHNPATIFHFELHWIGTAARCIEDMLRAWTRTIERYGLTLVEAYVTQISDVSDRNPFQSCFPVRLAVQPPVVQDIERRVPEHRQGEAVRYFEYALLRRFGFVLDIEATNSYPAHVDAVYSYRRAPFTYSQFVHRSGVAFVQVLGATQGFLFLTNRLMGSRVGASPVGIGKAQRPAVDAEELRVKLQAFCADKESTERPCLMSNFFLDRVFIRLTDLTHACMRQVFDGPDTGRIDGLLQDIMCANNHVSPIWPHATSVRIP